MARPAADHPLPDFESFGRESLGWNGTRHLLIDEHRRRRDDDATGDEDSPPMTTAMAVIASGALVILSTVLLSPGLDQLIKHLEEQGDSFASPETLGKVLVTTPAAVVAVMAFFGGWLLDRVGRRPVLLAGLAIFGVAGAAGGLLSSPVPLLISRVFVGVGLAGILLSSTTLIGDYYDGRERRTMLGWQLAFLSTSSVVMLFLAAYLVQNYSWRHPFAIFATSLLLLPWAWKTVHEPTEEQKESQCEDAEKEQPACEDGGLPWHQIALIYGGSFLALAIFHIATTQIPGYLDELGYGSPYASAGVIAMMSAVAVPSSLLFDRVRDKLSPRSLLLIVFGVGAAGFLIAGVKQHIATLLVGLFVFSLPYGLRTPSFNDWMLNVAPPKYRGRLMGGMTAATFAGIFCSPLISNPLDKAFGMPAVILIAAGMQAAFAGAFAYFAIFRRELSQEDQSSEEEAAAKAA